MPHSLSGLIYEEGEEDVAISSEEVDCLPATGRDNGSPSTHPRSPESTHG